MARQGGATARALQCRFVDEAVVRRSAPGCPVCLDAGAAARPDRAEGATDGSPGSQRDRPRLRQRRPYPITVSRHVSVFRTCDDDDMPGWIRS